MTDATPDLGVLAPFVVTARPGVRPVRLSLEGLTGSGKTWSALAVAAQLGERVCLLSVGEHGAETLYASLYNFSRVDLDAVASAVRGGAMAPPIQPGDIGAAAPLTGADPRLVAWAVRQLGAAFDVIILDSLSEVWGATLTLVDHLTAATRNGDKRDAWRRVTPAWDSVGDALMSVPAHTITTVRTKPGRDERGRQVEQIPEVRDRDRYRTDIIVQLDESHAGHVVKSRYDGLPMGTVLAPFDAAALVAATVAATVAARASAGKGE